MAHAAYEANESCGKLRDTVVWPAQELEVCDLKRRDVGMHPLGRGVREEKRK